MASDLNVRRFCQPADFPAVFILVEGGKLETNSENDAKKSAFLKSVAASGKDLLNNGGTAVKAVHHILVQLAQTGHRWQQGGDAKPEFHQSAFIMDGTSKKTGAVSNYRSKTVHAVEAARFVLEKTDYNLLCAERGQEFIEKSLEQAGTELEPTRTTLGFDKNQPLAIHVMAVAEDGETACGTFSDQAIPGTLTDAVVVGNGIYADSKVGSSVCCNFNNSNSEEASQLCLAWQTTQFMRDHETSAKFSKNPEQVSDFLAKSLRRYLNESSSIFTLQKASSKVEMSIFLFSTKKDVFRKNCISLCLASGLGGTFWSSNVSSFDDLLNSSMFLEETFPSPEFPIMSSDSNENRLCILIHGGAGAASLNYAPEVFETYKLEVQKAASVGYHVLADSNGSAAEAVCAAVRHMENHPVFNAGFGSYMTRQGNIEMDAILQDTETGRFSALGGIERVRNPIDVCAALINGKTSSDRLFLGRRAFEVADIVGAEQGVLISEKATNALKKWRENNNNDWNLTGTVGAVAVDCRGNIAAATSTGGLTGKIDGRVGDSPLPGSGNAADRRFGAVSATGTGEHIMSTCTSQACLDFMAKGFSAQEAAELAVRHLEKAWPGGGSGGLICLSPTGPYQAQVRKVGSSSVPRRWGFSFNTRGMCWAAVEQGDDGQTPRVHHGLFQGEFTSVPFA